MFFLLIILLVRIPSDTFVFARELHQALTQPARQDQNGIKTVQCNSGVGLVEAFADPTVQTALIVADIVLSASDFAARASPIRLERNFTILGAYAPKEQWVLLDFSYIRGRVVLSPGVTFSLSQLVIDGVRKGPYFQTPGMDIIIYMPKDPTMPYAYVLAYNCAYIQRTCLPDSVILASSGSIRRPTEVQPGKQLSDRLPLWQPCDPDPKAHALRRCWPKIGMYFDQAGYGADLVGPGDSPMPNNYIIWTYQVYYLCSTVMSEECGARAPVLCFYTMFPRDEDNRTTTNNSASISSSTTAAVPQPFSSTSKNATGGPIIATNATAADNPNQRNGPASELALAAPRQQQQQQQDEAAAAGASGGQRGIGAGGAVPLAPLLGGLLGGLAVMIATSLVVVVLRRRRRGGLEETKLQHQQDQQLQRVSHWNNLSGPYSGSDGGGCGQQQQGPYSVIRVRQLSSLAPLDDAAAVVDAAPPAAAAGAGGAAAATYLITHAGGGCTMENDCHCHRHPQQQQPEQQQQQPEQHKADLDAIYMPVTMKTPMQADVQLGLSDLDGGGSEVQLSAVVLGKGSFGRVVEGVYGGLRVAVKLLNTGLIWEQSGGTTTVRAATAAEQLEQQQQQLEQQQQQLEQQQEQLEQQKGADGASGGGRARGACWAALAQEVEVLARCRHPNIVRLLAASLEPPHVCLVMELMDTTLERLLYGDGNGKPGRELPLPLVLHIGMNIAQALSYLHPTILHRDLKPANVLIAQPDSDKPIAKLADFGLSRLRDTVLMTQNPEVGTAPYMAPEIFDLRNNIFTDRMDIYGLGVILWEMLSYKRPWEGLNVVQIAYQIALMKVRLPLHHLSDERCPRKLKALIWDCWDPDPARRPAAAEVVKALALVQESCRVDPNRNKLQSSSSASASFKMI